MKAPTSKTEMSRLARQGESASVEFKRSTGELKEGLQTACAFLNGKGGLVLFGVRPDGTVTGQEVSDKTLREIAEAMDRLEPPADLDVQRVRIEGKNEVIVLKVPGVSDSIPYTYEGRAYERVQSTTRKMPQERYEKLLLERTHSRRRWENQPAEGVTLKDLDREEIFRIVAEARAAERLLGPVGRDVTRLLDRLGVRRDGEILRAAVVLFGKEFVPDFPQCGLRLARFRGTDKTEFLDQKQLRGPAFKLLEEAQLFCQRHFPLPGKIVPERLQRVDTPLIPPDAMREILVNAFIHRDYSIAGGAVSLAIFDDRVEVWSTGTYPTGITPAVLSRQHSSVPRNPIIADVFYRVGLIERWGRGTNRVIEMCRKAGIRPPRFQEIGGTAVVTFRVPVGMTARISGQVESRVESEVEWKVESLGDFQRRVLAALRAEPLSKAQIARAVGKKKIDGQLHATVRELVARELVEPTIPGKLQSRLQQYRLTINGKRTLPESN